ncbi:MAG TPA: hypothetical protein VIY29_01005 [Ktedonobacteraceae bacterium]
MAEEQTFPTDSSDSETSNAPAEPSAPAAPAPLPARKKRHPFRIALSTVTFLIGLAVGMAAVFLLILILPATKPPITAPPPQTGNISVQADAALIGPIAQQSLQEAGIPGQISNLKIQFDLGDQMTITGSYQNSILGVSLNQNFSIVLQPYTEACSLKMHILSANYGNIPVTSFASIFENTFNNALQQVIPSTILHGSYALCISGVHTQTGHIIISITLAPK